MLCRPTTRAAGALPRSTAAFASVPDRPPALFGTRIRADDDKAGLKTEVSSPTAAAPDAELLALRPIWIETRARFEAAVKALSQAEIRFYARCPELPDLNTFPGSYAEYRAVHQRVREIWDALEIETGVVAAHKLEEQTSDEDSATVARIAAIPARTVEGIRFKREVLQDWDCQCDDLEQSITADLLARAGGLDA